MTDKDSNPELMVWVDLETTGLNERKDCILEVGIKVTDLFLKVLHEKSWLVRDEYWETALENASPLVQEMHEKSGLIAEIRALPDEWHENGQLYRPTPERVAFEGWIWLTETLSLPPGTLPMCGNTVHFDRRFADTQMPVLEGFFHYRNIDVSTLKELCRLMNPDLFEAMRQNPAFDKANAKHRSLPDIDSSIAELSFYVDNFLFVENPEEDEILP